MFKRLEKRRDFVIPDNFSLKYSGKLVDFKEKYFGELEALNHTEWWFQLDIKFSLCIDSEVLRYLAIFCKIAVFAILLIYKRQADRQVDFFKYHSSWIFTKNAKILLAVQIEKTGKRMGKNIFTFEDKGKKPLFESHCAGTNF